jgi:small conductance mechanosensitive channel
MTTGVLAAATTSGGSIADLFRRFGASDSLAHTAQVLLIGPVRVIIVLALAFALTRLVPRLARRLARGLQLRSPVRLPSPRADGRTATIASVMASIFRVVVWVVAVLSILGIFGVNLAPFVATATVIGATVGFGAQALVRDFLSGVLILAEDQYGVGDSITVADTSGTVEGLNLRTTRVRSLDGVVWYIPNGEIRKVGNSSDAYNQAVVDTLVPPGTDLVRAGEVMEDEARTVVADPAWRDVVLAEPVFLGAVSQGTDGVTLRLVVRTQAGQGLRTGRALRERITQRLLQEGVAWGPPNPAASTAPPESRSES